MFTIYQNDDFKCTIQVRNPVTKQPLDLSAFTGIGVWITYEDGTLLKKFASNYTNVGGTVMTGFAHLTITDAVNGLFLITLESAESKVAQEGIVNLQVKYQYTDTDVTDQRFHKSGSPIKKFAEIVTAPPSNQDLL